MPFVSAVCPTCGGQLEVDNGKEAGICKFCGNAFITEKAINNYHIKYEIKADTIVMNNKDSMEDLLEREAVYRKLSDIPHLEQLYEDMTQLYPQRHEGWWGKVTLGTEGFTNLNADMQEIEKWFGLVCEYAPKDALPPLEKQYHSYIVERMKLSLAQKQAELQQADADDQFQRQAYENSIVSCRRENSSNRNKFMLHLAAIAGCFIGVIVTGEYMGTHDKVDDTVPFLFLGLIGGGIALIVKLIKSDTTADVLYALRSPDSLSKEYEEYKEKYLFQRNDAVASIESFKKQIEDYADTHGISL